MNDIGAEYASALFALATEESREEELFLGLQTVSAVMADNPGYADFLASGNISREEKEAALDEAFSGGVPEYVISVLKLLAAKGHIRHLQGVVTAYNDLYNMSTRTLTAKVRSAVPLSDAEREKLRDKLEKLTGRTVILDTETDESLIGGMSVEYDGRIIDGSIRHRLQKIKEVIEK